MFNRIRPLLVVCDLLDEAEAIPNDEIKEEKWVNRLKASTKTETKMKRKVRKGKSILLLLLLSSKVKLQHKFTLSNLIG